jgi:hypothetical protein
VANTATSLLEGLLTVEVDLVVTEQLATRPPFEHPDDADAAVANLLADYRRWMLDRAVMLDADWATLVSSSEVEAARTAAWERAGLVENGRVVAGLDLGRLRDPPAARPIGDLPEIERVAQVAGGMCTVLAAAGRLTDPHVATVFRRIHGNAAQIRQVSDDSPYTADQLALLRKAVELGTDVILTQTVVQADGDLVVRVDPTILSGRMHHAMHPAGAAVDQALAYWRSLVDLVCVVATTAGTGPSIRLQLRALRRFARGLWRAGRSHEPTTAEQRMGPVQTWTLLRATGVALFSRGGATIESPPDGDDPYARTVVQPDGDALWFIRDDALTDRGLLDQHAARVADWYDSTGSAIASARAYLTRLQQAAAALLGILSAAGTVGRLGWWGIALAAGVAAVAPRLVRSVVGRLVRWRCGISAW